MTVYHRTYIKECTGDNSTPTHLGLIKRFLYAGNLNDSDLACSTNTPSNSAVIALYKDIAGRGARCHIIEAEMVEYFYSQLSPHIFNSYTSTMGFPLNVHSVRVATHSCCNGFNPRSRQNF